MTETPVPRTGPSHRHPESIMPLNRRNFLGAAALGAGSLMLGSAQAAPAPALPKFTPPTAKKPMALCFNENPLGLTPAARDAAIAALPDANRYPFVAAERLRKACADFMGGKPENVMLSHGSAESIRASIEAHIRPGVCLICPELTYSDGADTARKNNVKVVTVPMGAKWSVDLEAMKKTVAGINGPVIVYFVNPNNPPSTIVDSKALHDWIRSRPADVFFVIDEAYAEYVRDPSFVSCKTLVDEGLENLCVLKTFSKIFAMAGMRLGFTYAAPAVVNKVRTQVAYDIMLNNSAIAAALAAEPDVLILDEPTAALDPEGKQEVFDVLDRIRQTRSMTVIMAEQDTEHIAYWADQVLFMVNGEVVRNGDASLFTRERRLLESSGVRVSDGPSPVIKALPVGNDAKPKHAIISLDHVTHRYGQGGNASPALDDVSLDIEQGAFVGLIGRNGSGKTTLAKHLNGLIQPTQGIVNVDGLDVSKHSVGEMAAHVGFVFQNPDHQIFCSSTKEEIAFGPTALGLDAATVFKRVDEMMTLFDLHRYEDVSPATLGYGERRAVALSSVIAMRTPILVLDEPTAGLDHRLASRFLGTVEKLNRHGVTVIMISHDMRAVYRYCTHVLELEDGHIVQYGPIDKSQEAQQSPARQARQPYKSRGPVSATHVLLKIAKDECDKEER